MPSIANFEKASDQRFKFFTSKLWEKIYNEGTSYTILLVPSYFDFVRLRTFIKNKNA